MSSSSNEYPHRFRQAQRQRTLLHPRLPQPSPDAAQQTELERRSSKHTFVVCADTQLGMTNYCREWETELEYARQAVELISKLEPRPAFCCVCGDLVDMEYTFASFYPNKEELSRQRCNDIQDQQNRDFQQVWKNLPDDIALVCLCGNHDVGNRPTAASIERFRTAFGDEYLAFWANGTYNIVLNNVLFSDPTGAPDMFQTQLTWLQERLEYARAKDAANIFVFGHHPWFLYHEDEVAEDLEGGFSPYPEEWGGAALGPGFPDGYFHIPKEYREKALTLFRKYGVSAAFSGHFHQNLVSKTSWGMEMIMTAPLSMVFESTGKPPNQPDPNGRGIRIVEVQVPKSGPGKFQHWFELLG